LGPPASDEASVPADHCRRPHDQQRSAASGSVHHGCEQHKDRSIGLVEAWPIDLALQHEDLMAQSQDLGITGVTAGEQPSQPRQDESSEHSDQCHEGTLRRSQAWLEPRETQGG